MQHFMKSSLKYVSAIALFAMSTDPVMPSDRIASPAPFKIVLCAITILAGVPDWCGWFLIESLFAPRRMLFRMITSAADWMP